MVPVRSPGAHPLHQQRTADLPWMYPVFRASRARAAFSASPSWTVRGAGTAQPASGTRRSGVLGAIGSIGDLRDDPSPSFPSMPSSAGRNRPAVFPAMTGSLPFLMKDVVLLRRLPFICSSGNALWVTARAPEPDRACAAGLPLRRPCTASGIAGSITAHQDFPAERLRMITPDLLKERLPRCLEAWRGGPGGRRTAQKVFRTARPDRLRARPSRRSED